MEASRTPSGVPNLDVILGGGIPAEDVLLVLGGAGTGKTTLVLQVLFEAAARGEKVLYVSTDSEPTTKLLRHIRSFKFYRESLVSKNVFFLSAFPLLKDSLPAVLNALVDQVKEQRATLVAFDGLMAVHDLYHDLPAFRTFIYQLGATLATLNCTTVITSSGTDQNNQEFPEFTMADGILVLELEDLGSQTFRRMRVRKFRGQSPLLGRHTFQISARGLQVYPRLESVFPAPNVGLSPERVSSGMPELDALMGGGPPAATVTILAGATGTGKTLAGLQFALAGARRGERSFVVAFRETPQQLIDKARRLNLDLAEAVHSGQVVIYHRPPVDLDLDQVAWEILEELRAVSPRRLVIDSVNEIEAARVGDRNMRDFIGAFAAQLSSARVTSLLTKEIPQVVGSELDFSDTPLATVAENLILLRSLEFRSDQYRILSILKMRDSAYDTSIRQVVIGDRGLRILGPAETAEGLLAGIARVTTGNR